MSSDGFSFLLQIDSFFLYPTLPSEGRGGSAPIWTEFIGSFALDLLVCSADGELRHGQEGGGRVRSGYLFPRVPRPSASTEWRLHQLSPFSCPLPALWVLVTTPPSPQHHVFVNIPFTELAFICPIFMCHLLIANLRVLQVWHLPTPPLPQVCLGDSPPVPLDCPPFHTHPTLSRCPHCLEYPPARP